MKVVLSGVETNNKGAELMLYAILQEIERRSPGSTIYVAPFSVSQGLDYIRTSLILKEKPISRIIRLFRKYYIYVIARKLNISMLRFSDIYAIKGTDYFIDDGGYHFTDKWDLPEEFIQQRRKLWESHKKAGSKIIFLPQAFGPFEKEKSRRYLSYMSEFADVIMARENKSYEYLKNSGLVDMKKVKVFTDFTSLVEGVMPEKYKHLKNDICIIPNIRMTDKGGISVDTYLNFLVKIIQHINERGFNAYILNHEGKADEELAYKCKEKLNDKVEVVTGLNALEVKGLISSSYMVITSRFHGLVSSLNTCVPCLATGWSHKYAELYKDYNLSNCILPIEEIDTCYNMIDNELSKQRNAEVRCHLKELSTSIQEESRKMWNLIWNI